MKRVAILACLCIASLASLSQLQGFPQLNLNILAEMQARTEHAIDDGLYLLQQLESESNNELRTTTDANVIAVEGLVRQVAQQGEVVNRLENECMNYDDTLALMKEEYEKNRGLIEFLEGRIVANKNRVDTLKDIRCQSNVEWLNFIKSSKQILKLIDFLRTSIQSYKSFAEIKNIHSILETLKSESQMDISPLLLSIKQVEEEAEVSDDSILSNLNDVGKTKDIGVVKTQLIEILDNIEKSVKAKMNRSQTNEIITSLRVADFIVQLDQESVYYNKALGEFSSVLGQNPDEDLQAQEARANECRQRLTRAAEQQAQSQAAVSQRRIGNEQQEGRLAGQRDLVQSLIQAYVEGIHSLGDEYKNRVSTYAESQTFEPTPFWDQRELSRNFGGKVNQLNEIVDDMARGVAAETVQVTNSSNKFFFQKKGGETVDSDSNEQLASDIWTQADQEASVETNSSEEVVNEVPVSPTLEIENYDGQSPAIDNALWSEDNQEASVETTSPEQVVPVENYDGQQPAIDNSLWG